MPSQCPLPDHLVEIINGTKKWNKDVALNARQLCEISYNANATSRILDYIAQITYA